MSCERLPQRTAARIPRSSRICSTSPSSAAVNRCFSPSFAAPTLGAVADGAFLLTTEVTAVTEKYKIPPCMANCKAVLRDHRDLRDLPGQEGLTSREAR